MDFNDYKKWFTTIFGLEATKAILDNKNECISKNEEDLLNFFKSYNRIEKCSNFNDRYRIKGCNQCVSRGIIVRQQDVPGFLGKLNEIKYVIIGLETKLPDNLDIHIAFDQYGKNVKEHHLFKKLELILSGIKKKAYVTDIAKCNSSNLHRSRIKCLETHFLEELKILLAFNPELKIIFQGTKVEWYFSNYLKIIKTSEVIKTKKYGNYLFKHHTMSFDNKKIPTITLPHGSTQTSKLWNEIAEKEVKDNIKSKLKDF